MPPKSFLLDESLHSYLVAHSTALDPVATELMATTAALGDVARMQSAPEQGVLLGLLTALVGARHAVEVGTFTGFSALAIARALPVDGTLLCCDVNETWAAIARRAWRQAAVEDRIDLRLGPAADTLAALAVEPQFDLAFIDADKGGYLRYYEELVPRMRPGGLLLVDNTLWSGQVVDAASSDETVQIIRAFNDHVAADERIETVLLPVADGLTLCRVRG